MKNIWDRRVKKGRIAMAEQKKIAVIFGGCSPEYGVSLQSASAVISHLDQTSYAPVPIGITEQGDWFYFSGDIEKISTNTWHNSADCVPVAVSLSRSDPALLKYGSDQIEKISIDAAFPVLHGKNGEDGTVQGLFELAGIPVVGCGVLSSALCMDKDRAHQLAQAAGVSVPQAYVLRKTTAAGTAFALAEKIGYPLFVKPVKAGSSFGVTKAAGPDDLPAAIRLAFAYDARVLIEEAISGFEVGCAILGNDDLLLGAVDEIALNQGFFDFTEKYTLKTSAIHLPARIDPGTADRIKQTAKRIYRVLDCQGFARVDLFLTAAGKIIFNEVNTIPGFTPHSRFPNMLKAVGMSFEQVVSMAIELALTPPV